MFGVLSVSPREWGSHTQGRKAAETGDYGWLKGMAMEQPPLRSQNVVVGLLLDDLLNAESQSIPF